MGRSQADQSHRFLFEDADIRGESVRLGKAYRDILAIHQYAPGVSRLMGEFLAAAVLLSNNLKFEGRLILQARSAGQLPLLMAECDHTLGVRGIARGAEEATASDNAHLLAGGQLVITIDPDRGQRYQGIVPIEGASLAASIDAYFKQSEQLKTRLWLAADGERAGGLLLQQLPAQVVATEDARADQWQHACTLAETVAEEELLALDTEHLLVRLYHEDALRLFEPAPVRFQCTCSRERTLGALATIDPAEIEDILSEMGAVTMDCEFCQARYIFERRHLTELPGIDQSKTLH